MTKLSSAIVVAVLAVFALASERAVFADGGVNEIQPITQPTLDPRLPPVIPGEEVIRNGKKIKVWSTSGSPSVDANSPTIQNDNSQYWNQGYDNGQIPPVIVDGRGPGMRPRIPRR